MSIEGGCPRSLTHEDHSCRQLAPQRRLMLLSAAYSSWRLRGTWNLTVATRGTDSGNHPPGFFMALAFEQDSSQEIEAGASVGSESASSSVSWAAIIAGAVVAASVSLILIAIGAGFGLLSASPWAGHGVSVTTFTAVTAIWFIVIQWVASAVGGYITGRLRTKWTAVHTHEVFFRDTAQGFVTWSLATLLVAFVLASSAASLVSGGTHATASPTSAAPDPLAGSYDLDVLFRGASFNAGESARTDPRPEVMRLVANGLANKEVPSADRSYLAGLVAARTGISQAEANQRVEAFITHSKETADKLRKASAAFAIFTGISLLIGAFVACVAATLGGRERDAVVGTDRRRWST